MRSRRVAVVGAGMAGLSAAWRLLDAGADVTIYDAAAAAGGRVRTVELDGVRADATVQLLAGHYRRTLALAAKAGLRDLLVPAPGRDALWRRGRAHPMELGSVPVMATSGALPAGLKLRLLTRYVPFLRKIRRRLDVGDLASLDADGDEPVAEWGRREIGADFVELLADPLLATTHGIGAEETSAWYFHALSAAGMDLTLWAVRGGVAALPAGLARAAAGRGATLALGTPVAAVLPSGTGWRVESASGAESFDGVVVAVPASRLPELIPVAAPLARWLAGVQARPAAALLLRCEPVPAADFFGLSFPAAEGGGTAAVCVQGAKYPGERRAADVLVVLPRPDAAARLAGAEPRAAFELLMPAVRRALPDLEQGLGRVLLVRVPDGQLLVPPGAGGRTRSFDPDWLPAGIALAGDYLRAPSVEGAVRSGEEAAARLLAVAAPPAG
jgi:protoporphyrinogen/coproporphyrinogen III oxidase